MVYSHHLALFRRCRFVRRLAVLFLLWTAVDLLDVQLCALDRWALPHSSTAERHEPASLNASTTTNAPTAPLADDCFCCSHTVMSACAPAPTLVARMDRATVALETKHSTLVRPPLYHPPQIS